MKKSNRRGYNPREGSWQTSFGNWMQEHSKSPAQVAEALGCSLSTVYALATGDFRPGIKIGWAIAELTKGKVPFTKKAWEAR